MGNRAADWLRQAEADLKHARTSLDHGEHEWSCFASQQAAEKAVAAGAPTDYFTKDDAEESIGHAESILAFCEAAVRQPSPDPGPGLDNGGRDPGGAP
jgi:HEPN domain-containing protein